MLTAFEISKSYGRTEVLHDISFDLADGRVTGLLGPNGAGKSTLLHILAGITRPTSGRVTFSSDDEVAVASRAELGFCADDLPLPELLTGREYLDLVAGVRGLDRQPDAESLLLEGMRLQDAANRLIGSYSHGMKRKLQLVAALLHSPRILVLDEPFRGLDPESAAIMKSLLRRYAELGNAVLVSTHDLLVAEQLCSEVLVVREGRLLANQSVASLREASVGASLEDSFLRLTGLSASSEESSAIFFDGIELLSASHPAAR